jgi:hypothetical protein
MSTLVLTKASVSPRDVFSLCKQKATAFNKGANDIRQCQSLLQRRTTGERKVKRKEGRKEICVSFGSRLKFPPLSLQSGTLHEIKARSVERTTECKWMHKAYVCEWKRERESVSKKTIFSGRAGPCPFKRTDN